MLVTVAFLGRNTKKNDHSFISSEKGPVPNLLWRDEERQTTSIPSDKLRLNLQIHIVLQQILPQVTQQGSGEKENTHSLRTRHWEGGKRGEDEEQEKERKKTLLTHWICRIFFLTTTIRRRRVKLSSFSEILLPMEYTTKSTSRNKENFFFTSAQGKNEESNKENRVLEV
mgnify:CR=1 FL=1